MKPGVVADVGNSRVKWGLCAGDRVVEAASLPPDDADAWLRQLAAWGLDAGPRDWTVCGVHPARRDRLADWLRGRGHRVEVLATCGQLPVPVQVDSPDRVGIDRLLNAVAARPLLTAGQPAVLVDAGSAVTVDWLDGHGVFRGGAIFPGLRLMAQALHHYTALLPLVQVEKPLPPVPATHTAAALEAGIYWATAGGIRELLGRYKDLSPAAPRVFLTGGDALRLQPALPGDVTVWPLMTLEGIRRAATLPP